MNPFPTNLRNMRTRIGYTQEELSAAALAGEKESSHIPAIQRRKHGQAY